MKMSSFFVLINPCLVSVQTVFIIFHICIFASSVTMDEAFRGFLTQIVSKLYSVSVTVVLMREPDKQKANIPKCMYM